MASIRDSSDIALLDTNAPPRQSHDIPFHTSEPLSRPDSSTVIVKNTSPNMLISPSPETDVWGDDWRLREELSPSEGITIEDRGIDIPIASSSKAAEQTVAPYLAHNIPQTYNPLKSSSDSPQLSATNIEPNTKFCNRHRPDIKCRRQADEESMDLLQRDLATLSNSDQQGISHMWSLFSAAPAKQRNLMLRGILSVCCFPQLSYISSSIQELIKIDFISMLPAELGFKILCYLDTTSLCKAAQVSRNWRTLADDDVVWHRMCEQHIDRKCTRCGWGLPLMDRKRLRIEKRQIQLRASGRGLNEWSPNITPIPESRPQNPILDIETPTAGPSSPKRGRDAEVEVARPQVKRHCTLEGKASTSAAPTKRPWKDVYKTRFTVSTNWKHGRCSTRILKGHTNGVMCLQFNDNILATGSYDATVKIWDMEKGKVIRTLTGHTAGVRCLQFDEQKLISGSLDGTLRIWDWRTGECQKVMSSQRGGVISLHFDKRFLACGTMENAIRIWSTCDATTFSLKGHTDFVNSVKVDHESRTLFSASDDCTVKLWDLVTRQCLRTFEGHVGQVQQVLPLPAEFEFDEEDLVTPARPEGADGDTSGDEAGSNVSQSQQPALNAQPLPHRIRNIIVPASLPPPVFSTPLWPHDLSRPQPPTYMLTGALDSTIRLWHVPSGRCLRTFFGHLEGIWALAADTLRVVSGAEDRMVKVWDPRTGKCERTFVGHAGPVTCIALSGERLVSGGEDCEVRILEFDGGGEEGIKC